MQSYSWKIKAKGFGVGGKQEKSGEAASSSAIVGKRKKKSTTISSVGDT